MGVLGESWCFCSGGGKSERLKATIFSNKSAAMASLSSAGGGEVAGSGFLMHKNLLLTTHVNLPSALAAESAEIRLQNGVVATLVPHRFFITSSVLDLTIVGLDSTEGDSNSLGLKTYSNPSLDLGSVVYVLGYTGHKELSIGEGKVVIATDNLIKLSPDGVNWSPGSAGFDSQGNLAFMICDPMKLATSPYTKPLAPSTSSSSLFGIPMPIICGWLNQHLEPKQTLMRPVSAGDRSQSHPSESSLITNQIFKASEAEDSTELCSSNEELKAVAAEPCANTRALEVPIPEICEPPEATATPEETSLITLLDAESDPSVPEADVSSSGSANEAESSPARVAGSEVREGKQAENSAETAESRSNSSPREGSFRESVGRGQRGRLAVHKYPVAHKSSSVEKHSSLMQPKKSFSQGATSIKKKMNANLEKAKPAVRIRQAAVSSSPRWVI